MPTMELCHPKVFDIKLDWARQQPGFQCVRAGEALEYWLDGEVYLRVVPTGDYCFLYARSGDPVAPTPGGYK